MDADILAALDGHADVGEAASGGTALPFSCRIPQDELLNRLRAGVPCEDADEFLARARLEASLLPRVTRVDDQRLAEIEAEVLLKTKKAAVELRNEPDLPQPSPSASWRSHLVDQFRSLREYLDVWEDRRFGQATCGEEIDAFDASHGIKAVSVPSKSDARAWQAMVENDEPLLSVLMELDQSDASRVLKDLIYSLMSTSNGDNDGNKQDRNSESKNKNDDQDNCDEASNTSSDNRKSENKTARTQVNHESTDEDVSVYDKQGTDNETETCREEPELQQDKQQDQPKQQHLHIPGRTLRWMYGLLLRLDTPLSVGMESHLRDLLRLLCTRRRADKDADSDVLLYILHDHFDCFL
mmetsp:Transcript_4907/g.10157  ORF Transcript_4907/g.10157 Transcript_4907/m.10157 type:complete len:354 (-) Transcript_4907:1503-2564(-)